MIFKPGQVVESFFQIEIGGVLTNVDPATFPLVQIYRNQILTSIEPTVSNIKTGVYSFSFELPTNWVNYDQIFAWIQSTINGFTAQTFKPIGTIVDIQEEKLQEIWSLLGLNPNSPVTHSVNQISVEDLLDINLTTNTVNNTVTSQRA